MKIRAFWIVALGGALSCSSDPTSPPECSAPVTIQVSSGTSPTFDWTPACSVRDVWVTTVPVGQIPSSEQHWHVGSATREITPPVRYGEVPAGATQLGPVIPLQPGEHYQVRLDSGLLEFVMSIQDFVP